MRREADEKLATSDTLAAPMAFWQCHYPSNIPRSAAQTTRVIVDISPNICAEWFETKLEKRKFEKC
jgi:hypothetical protein